MKCLKVIFTFLLIFASVDIFAQTGCYVSTMDRIYTPVIPGLNVALLSGFYNTNCPPGSTTSTLFANVSSSGSTSCTIVASLGGTVLASGFVRNYTMLQCPIDDYSWILIASSASLAFFKIRKRKD